MTTSKSRFFRYQRWLSIVAAALIFLLAKTDNNWATTKTDSMDQKQVITKIVQRQAQGWENGDAEAIAADFADDAIFIAPGFVFEGKEKIKAAAEAYFKQFSQTEVEIKRIITENNQGAVEWDWRDQNQQTGEQSYAEDAIIFELKDDKIVYWREYIDKRSRSRGRSPIAPKKQCQKPIAKSKLMPI